MMQISENLQRFIKERNTTISDLSFDSRITYQRVASIAQGKTQNPRIHTLVKLANALEVTVEDLIRPVEDAR